MFIIGIVFAKSHLTTSEIGIYETLIFIAGAISFFWVNGLIQSFLPLYNSNKSSTEKQNETKTKDTRFYNAFLLISLFSVLSFLFIYFFKGYFADLFNNGKEIPHINLLMIYVLLNNPSFLIEYIYLLKNRVKQVVRYGIIIFSIQFIVVAFPVILGYGIITSIYGLIIISVIRLIWLFYLLNKYSHFSLSLPFIKEHISLGYPLILSALLSGSALYIDGIIISNKFDNATFAIFRYGAREFPIVVLLANAFSNAMLPEFSLSININEVLFKIKEKSKKLMHFLFPLTIVFMLISKWLYPIIFNQNFAESADIFNIYLLLIVSRLIFPHTILIGNKKTNVILSASLLEIIINVSLSLLFIKHWGILGVAFATIIAHYFQKAYWVVYNCFITKINPGLYIPVSTYTIYSVIIFIVYLFVTYYF